MLLAMNRRLRRTQGYLAVAFAAVLALGPELAEAQDAAGTPPCADGAAIPGAGGHRKRRPPRPRRKRSKRRRKPTVHARGIAQVSRADRALSRRLAGADAARGGLPARNRSSGALA